MISRNQIKYIKDLGKKSFRAQEKAFVVEGEKLVDELLETTFEILDLFATASWESRDTPKSVSIISDNELGRISQLKSPNKVLAVVKIPEVSNTNNRGEGLSIFLDRINDPGNLGTIIRMADWFNIKHIYCSNESVDVYNHKVVQSSMGSVFRVHVSYVNPVSFLSDYTSKYPGNQIIGAAMNGEKLNETDLSKNALLIMGSESHGINPELDSFINKQITIPKLGGAESLNVAVATGIILWELNR